MAYIDPDNNIEQCHPGRIKYFSVNVPDKETVAEIFFVNAEDIDTNLLKKSDFLSVYKNLNRDSDTSIKIDYTALLCKSLLTTILSRKLGVDPLKITFRYSEYGKPELNGHHLNFNVSHTRGAFAIGISENNSIGIDLEAINYRKEYESVIRRFFSPEEIRFVFNESGDEADSFFLLWTRKEALLKAFGIGIISELAKIEVCRPSGRIDKTLLNLKPGLSIANNQYIYSTRIYNNYLSVALPKSDGMKLIRLDKEKFNLFIENNIYEWEFIKNYSTKIETL